MQKENNELRRSLGFGSAISIVIGTIIGSEIFFKQASILDSAGSSTMAIAAWIFGDVITLTAGLTIAEIGAQMPYTGGFGVAVLATLFGYDGWILITNLGGEMKNPQKLLPKAIFLGISSVLVIYTLITIGIFRFVPANMIHSLGENTTSYLTTKAFGEIGGKLLSIGIIISMMGTLNGKIITFPRIVYAMARRGNLPFSRMLSYVTPKGKAPIIATVFIIILATIMMIFFDPDHLSYLCVFTASI